MHILTNYEYKYYIILPKHMIKNYIKYFKNKYICIWQLIINLKTGFIKVLNKHNE